eukprot:scaffold44962_cov18-Tisochrysis_lutea.AAC.3
MKILAAWTGRGAVSSTTWVRHKGSGKPHWIDLQLENPDRGVRGEAIAEAYDAFEKGATQAPMTHAAISNQTIQESMRLILLVRSFQVMGHFAAKLDPLELDKRIPPAELDPAYWGFTERDLDRE